MSRIRSSHKKGFKGFTLIELVLTLVLVLGLLGAVVFNFSSFQRGASLDEGAVQMEALFRFARAHAASTGRQVRVELRTQNPDGSSVSDRASSGKRNVNAAGVRIVWEPDPVKAPGVFEELREASNFLDGINDAVELQTVVLDGETGESKDLGLALDSDSETTTTSGGSGGFNGSVSGFAAGKVNPNASSSSRDPMQPVTFYPDGSGDTVQVVLTSKNEEDDRRLAVRMVGVTGSVQRWVMPDPSQSTAESDTPAATTGSSESNSDGSSGSR